jgi:hypothetical protein
MDTRWHIRTSTPTPFKHLNRHQPACTPSFRSEILCMSPARLPTSTVLYVTTNHCKRDFVGLLDLTMLTLDFTENMPWVVSLAWSTLPLSYWEVRLLLLIITAPTQILMRVQHTAHSGWILFRDRKITRAIAQSDALKVSCIVRVVIFGTISAIAPA